MLTLLRCCLMGEERVLLSRAELGWEAGTVYSRYWGCCWGIGVNHRGRR